ncbi:MAG: hypothetical protein QOH39_2168 [Verrucomicrobiota bacterium]|jgi:2-polyprenyl-3-methyl-5-hydroxy-6-metoxy-1,4-benzoquinol methylase
MTDHSRNGLELRLLVAIVSYGEKNLSFLRRIIDNYRRVPMKVDIVVLSEAPKDLGPEIRVEVGLPTRNPWSLAFAHKRLFAENVDRYDLFAYSEDDMEVTAAHIEAFLRITAYLQKDEIAGYLRYEVAEGKRFFPDAHGPFRWKPDSVRRRGEFTIAEHTNEHAAFYLLDRAQLQRAIDSGGFLREPYEERYDMLCSAATDPYTHCGFRKVICVSALTEFMIHHMSNRYAGKVGLAENRLMEQVQALIDIENGTRPVSTLCNVESKLRRSVWSKNCYEESRKEILELVPHKDKRVLSIGCGWGDTEMALVKTGYSVTAVPLDSVIGTTLSRLGVEVILGTLSECLAELHGRKFDCVIITHLLHLFSAPEQTVTSLTELVSKNGSILVASPNFHSLPVIIRRFLRMGDIRKLRCFKESGITTCRPGSLRKHLARLGFHTMRVNWYDRTPEKLKWLKPPRRLERFFTRNWALLAQM